MKKLTAVLLALLLAATLCFGAMAEEAVSAESAMDYTGSWTATSIMMGAIAMDPAAMGLQMTIELNADATFTLSAMGEITNGTWAVTETGIATTNETGLTDNYTLVDGTLVAEAQGAKVTFSHVAPVDYTGVWTATGLEMNGAMLDPVGMGLEMTMELNADGTCTLSMMGEVHHGIWTVTATGITAADETGVADVYTLIDGQLVAENSGMKFFFSHGNVDSGLEEAVPAAILSNLTLSDFNGNWKLTSIEALGMVLSPEAFSLTLDISLQDGAGTYTTTSPQATGTVAISATVSEVEEVGTVMQVYMLDEAGQPAAFGPTLVLRDNGVMVWDVTTEEMELRYCLEQQVEETAAE